MNGPLRFGVIGAGRVGTLHCELLAHGVEGAAVSAVCDVDRDRAAAAAALARGAIAIADPAELIGSPDVDAVAICSATDTHAELIEAAAAAAKPVFCEKPVANEPAAVERACAAAERAVRTRCGVQSGPANGTGTTSIRQQPPPRLAERIVRIGSNSPLAAAFWLRLGHRQKGVGL